MSNGNYLLLFTITPVQDFISQSRKLKDLFGSSEILSCMSEIGLKICLKREGAKEIFPKLQQKGGSYPNRFLVEFKDKSLDDIKKIAKEIETSLLKFLRGLNDKNHSLIEQHIENYFVFYWAISEIEDDGKYKQAFKKVEKRLAGAKNIRFFTQLGDGEGERGRKCSICGERNVVIAGKKMYKKLSLKEYDNLLAPTEGLCGVCYVKRKYAKKNRFESTADIALMNIFGKNGLNKDSYQLLKNDTQLFYEENLREGYFESQGIDKNELQKYKAEFQRFKNDLKKHNLKQTSYYAAIMFDGDNMGKWLSGEYIEEEKLKEFHESLSEKLLEFANQVKSIENLVTVYAGGEDFLGFVNINYLFDTLQQLRQKWDSIINESLKDEFDLQKELTFSAGVVVAHYKTPLNEVLKQLRGAEKRAKNYKNKNSICFRALKRSGEIREGIISFKKLETYVELYEKLKEYGISDSFIPILESEFLKLCDKNGNLQLARRNSILGAEIIRLLRRKRGAQDFDEKVVASHIERLISEDFSNFSDLLNILRFLKRETDGNRD